MPQDFTNPTFVQQQFQNTVNLNARIDCHARFSQNKYGWFPWVFDQFKFRSTTQILELGCGAGDLWWENQQRISPDWQLTISDLFLNMVDKAEGRLKKLSQPLSWDSLVVDAQAIPFKDAAFEIVVALHVLLFLQDRKTAFEEIVRVLKPQGRFFASSVGQTNLQELWAFIDKFDPHMEQWLKKRPRLTHTLES
ncbi:MAG: class I SAM-dependent methyltransferase [Candidatus Hodarchaeales archaeon]|jgi:ubiquinone/menaquinone biosynthesis C-methylase UbiE